jgi:hypothetical protein
VRQRSNALSDRVEQQYCHRQADVHVHAGAVIVPNDNVMPVHVVIWNIWSAPCGGSLAAADLSADRVCSRDLNSHLIKAVVVAVA